MSKVIKMRTKRRIDPKQRAFQDEMAAKILERLKAENRALLVMPTGTGKTSVCYLVAQKLKAQSFNKKPIHVCIISHRYDIQKDQLEKHNQEFPGLFNSPNVLSGFTKDRTRTIQKSDLLIASIQTLSPNHRLIDELAAQNWDLVVIDEAHHAAAAGYMKVIDQIKKRNLPLLGLTATYIRPDDTPGGELRIPAIFGAAIDEMDFWTAVNRKFIAKPVTRAIITNTSLVGVKVETKNGVVDFKRGDLDKKVIVGDRTDIIIKAYKKYAKGYVTDNLKLKPKTICFCVSVGHAQFMAGAFRELGGIKSEFLCADAKKMSFEERQEIFKKFKETDEIEVLCVVDTIGEGVDIPDANIALMCRPTRSYIVYMQQVGRVTRRAPKKNFCYVLDFVDVTSHKYTAYTMAQLMPLAYQKKYVLYEYSNEKDVEIQNRQVQNLMKGPTDFKEEMLQEAEESAAVLRGILKKISEDLSNRAA